MRPLLAPLALMLALAVPPAPAAEQRTVSAAPGVEIPVALYPADGDTVLLWTPTALGFTAAEAAYAEALSRRGVESWMADLLAGRFLPTLESSMAQIPAGDVAALIRAARTRTGKRVVLLCGGHGCNAALRGAVADDPPDGVVMIYPSLYAHAPEPGGDVPYLAETAMLKAPAVLLQPELSAGRWRLDELARALEGGGARVRVTLLPGVRDRFYDRPDANATERALCDRFPQLMEEALAALRQTP